MRVLMLSKACLVGLYQRKLEEIAQHPAVSALKVLVPPSWRDERGEMVLERAFVQGYDLEVTPIRFNGYFHLHYYPAFAQAVCDFRPDVVHIDEEPYNLATWLALRATQKIGAKSLFFSWQNIKRDYPPPFNWGEQWVLRHIDYALMGTESAAQVWREKGYKGRYAVIPQFGVDPDLFPPKTRLAKAEGVCIGYVGRLVYEKGIDIVLHALSHVEGHWRLHIIGGGPEEAQLKAYVEAQGWGERVTFVGQVPSIEMPRYFKDLDVLVIPSRTMPNWKEQFGRVIIEAMASEIVVVGSDSGAIPDVIGDGGVIFPEGDVAALAHQLSRLLNDATLRHKLGEQGRARVLAEFTQAHVAAQTVAAYQTMLGY